MFNSKLEAMRKLTLFKAINDFESSNKNIGTLLIFVEQYEDGDRKGQQIMSWDKDPKHMPESDEYTMDDEGRISPALVTKKMIRREDAEAKIRLAAELDMQVHF